MKTAFVIYNDMTALDFIGVYDPLCRLKSMGFMEDFRYSICSFTDKVTDSNGLQIIPDICKQPFDSYDLIIVPGGYGSRRLGRDVGFIDWLRTAQGGKIIASVCSGSLLLGAAGFLKGKKATTHPGAFHELEKYCSVVSHKRIVDEGDIITAGGVCASIDLGLYLCERLAGANARGKIQKQMDYPYYRQED